MLRMRSLAQSTASVLLVVCLQEPPVTIEIAETRSTFFDWLILLGAAAYSIAIYLAIRGVMSTKLLEGEPPYTEANIHVEDNRSVHVPSGTYVE